MFAILGIWTVAFAVCLCVASVPTRAVYADAPAYPDFGQHTNTHSHTATQGKKEPAHALFVTKKQDGQCLLEEHTVVDDAITGFVGEHPAWQLNIALTCYFMEPVYERDTSLYASQDGRVAV